MKSARFHEIRTEMRFGAIVKYRSFVKDQTVISALISMQTQLHPYARDSLSCPV